MSDQPTPRRVHISIAVNDLNSAVRFYGDLFNASPSKERPGYAKFEPQNPPVNLSLIESPTAAIMTQQPSHFGIEVQSSDDVAQTIERFKAANYAIEVEDKVDCCYAVQDKVWIKDPMGNKWEVFTVLDSEGSDQGACCATDAQSNAKSEDPCCSTTAEPSCC